jgi:hypothetical protein
LKRKLSTVWDPAPVTEGINDVRFQVRRHR